MQQQADMGLNSQSLPTFRCAKRASLLCWTHVWMSAVAAAGVVAAAALAAERCLLWAWFTGLAAFCA